MQPQNAWQTRPQASEKSRMREELRGTYCCHNTSQSNVLLALAECTQTVADSTLLSSPRVLDLLTQTDARSSHDNSNFRSTLDLLSAKFCSMCALDKARKVLLALGACRPVATKIASFAKLCDLQYQDSCSVRTQRPATY